MGVGFSANIKTNPRRGFKPPCEHSSHAQGFPSRSGATAKGPHQKGPCKKGHGVSVEVAESTMVIRTGGT